MTVQVLPLVEGPKCFTLVTAETIDDQGYGIIFRAKLLCACGKSVYGTMYVDDLCMLEMKAFWQHFWRHLITHERADMDVEPGLRDAIELQLQEWERAQ